MRIYNIIAIHHYYPSVLNNTYMSMTLCNNIVIIIIIISQTMKNTIALGSSAMTENEGCYKCLLICEYGIYAFQSFNHV